MSDMNDAAQSSLNREPEPELMDIQAEADAYAQADFSEVNEAFVQRLLELAGDRPTASCIDLGCGPADIPIRLAKGRPGWRIVAVDASAPMLEAARETARAEGVADRIDFVRADACSPGLADDLDVVMSNSILHHVADPALFWRRVAELAAGGALVFLRDLFRPPDLDELQRLVVEHSGKESPLCREEFRRSLLAAYTPEEIRAQLAAAGLEGLAVAAVTDRHVDVWGRPRST
jgi:2-polyprenyl-3-methyl-5-hydroxy-6-metoxy-1,4-benzoquinol methylase